MHIYGRDQKTFNLQGTRGERWFLHLFTLTTGVHVACFLFAIVRTASNAKNSMRNNFFVSSPLELDEVYLNETCAIEVNYPRAFFSEVSFILSTDNVEYIVSRCVTNIRMLFTLTGLHLFVCLLNHVWVWMGIREVRYHFVVIRKDALTLWEVFLTVAGIVMLWAVEDENQMLVLYVYTCGNRYMNKFSNVLPYIELYISFYFTLGVIVINWIAAIWVRLKSNPRERLLREETEQQRMLQDMYDLQAREGRQREQPLWNSSGQATPPGQENHVTLATTAAQLLPDSYGEPQLVAAEFGPSVSRPQTPTTIGPEAGNFANAESAAHSVVDASWRSRDVAEHMASLPASLPSAARFQPPPPPPPLSLGVPHGPLADGTTEETVELDFKA